MIYSGSLRAYLLLIVEPVVFLGFYYRRVVRKLVSEHGFCYVDINW